MFDVDESGRDFAHFGESRGAAERARVVIEDVPLRVAGVARVEGVAASIQGVEFVGVDVGGGAIA